MAKASGKIYYSLLLSVDKDSSGKLVVTDTLPQGLTYVEDSLKAAFYSNDWYTWTKQDNGYDLEKDQKPQIAAEKLADGRTKLTITLPAGYDSSSEQKIRLTYQASYTDDRTWQDMKNTSKTYVNTAGFKGDEDSQKTTIKRDVPVLAKTGSQVKDASGSLTNEVAYQVNINPAADDLNPNGDTVILTDQLSMPDGMQAYLKLKETKLYQYDPTAKDHLGKELDPSLYSLNYDPDKQQLKLELPDKQACVLVYHYSFDSGDNIDPTVSNSASLAGHYSANTSSKLTNSDSSASIAAKKVTVYKVDADNNAKTLPGAQFSLEEQDNGSWKKVSSNLTTDKEGKVVVADLDNNAVYRIKETKAPEGYGLNQNYYYLSWMNGKKSKSEIYSGLAANIQNEIGGQKNVHFFASAGGSIYVPDSYCQLKVSKTWLNHDGTAGQAGVPEITVHLYRAVKKLDGVKVKVTVIDGWGNTNSSYDWTVAKGSTVSLSWEKQGAIDSSGLASVLVNGIDQQLQSGSKAFASSALNEDTNIVIKANSWINSPEIDKTDPQLAIDQTSKTLVDTVKLSSANNWQYVWSDLPQEDKDGNSLVYFAEEEAVPGYTSSYRNNNGIKNGEITILNQAKSENFALPKAGATGIWAYAAIGVSAALTASWTARRKKK
ncbi:SpaA isopeptide-forming pilin-related protein [Lactobacillus sp.]|uniref:SpaA isopeptide-forming pilin-related protein n=1 Tax=Lactobacillus sp. TaxID=1591 RepID=UPI003F10F0C1